jgi:tetratricopeptide (TPR) repeat protein
MEKAIADVRDAANRGISQMKLGRRDRAAVEFDAALNATEAIGTDEARREEVSVLATLFANYGFHDLALLAAEDAVDLDRSLGLEAELTGDLLAVGNAHTNLDNEAKAEAAFNEAQSIALRLERWGDAASATTNLAGMNANRGQLKQAADMLQTSLGYLARERFDETEINTRITLLQVLELSDGDLAVALTNATTLCGSFWKEIPPHARDVVATFVNRLISRYGAAHADARTPAWKATHFPMFR